MKASDLDYRTDSPQSLAIAAYFNERRAGKCEFEALLVYHSTYAKRVFDLAVEHGSLTTKWSETRGTD